MQDRRLVLTRTYVRTVRAGAKASPAKSSVYRHGGPQAVVPGARPRPSRQPRRRHPERVALALDHQRRHATASSSAAYSERGRPGGWSGKARQSTPTARSPAVRQATRAPEERPPATSGSPSSSPSAELVDQPKSTRHRAGPQAPGSAGRPPGRAARRERRRHLLRRGRRGRNEVRRPTPPPAPWPSTSAALRRLQVGAAGPCGVSTRALSAPPPTVRRQRGLRGAEAAHALRGSLSPQGRSPARPLRLVSAQPPVRSLTPYCCLVVWIALCTGHTCAR